MTSFVSVDSGLLYVAVTLGKPVVGIFSHLAALERLWLAPAYLAIQPHLPCSPCGEGPGALHCLDRQPQVGAAQVVPPCLSLIDAAVVEAAAAEVLRQEAEGVRRRLVWSLAPGGTWKEWKVDELPAPWRSPLIRPENPQTAAGRGEGR